RHCRFNPTLGSPATRECAYLPWEAPRERRVLPCAAMSLSSVIATHKVIVTVGSGGVGKTTTAAAISVRAAAQGKRVLCLTIDPARRLANSLGLREMTT